MRERTGKICICRCLKLDKTARPVYYSGMYSGTATVCLLSGRKTLVNSLVAGTSTFYIIVARPTPAFVPPHE